MQTNAPDCPSVQPSRGMAAAWALSALALTACAGAAPSPRVLPPAGGAPVEINLDGTVYAVGRTPLDGAPGGEIMRVYRRTGAEFGYDEGLTAKTVALAYCGSYNRGLNPAALGMFSPPGVWVFPGGCQ